MERAKEARDHRQPGWIQRASVAGTGPIAPAAARLPLGIGHRILRTSWHGTTRRGFPTRRRYVPIRALPGVGTRYETGCRSRDPDHSNAVRDRPDTERRDPPIFARTVSAGTRRPIRWASPVFELDWDGGCRGGRRPHAFGPQAGRAR